MVRDGVYQAISCKDKEMGMTGVRLVIWGWGRRSIIESFIK